MKKTTNSELSILVVDDEESIRMVLHQSLEKEGYHVSTAKNTSTQFFQRCDNRYHDGGDERGGIID